MGWLKNLRRRRQDRWDLSTPLFYLENGVPITIGQAMEHIHIWGSTGSGKTSGSFYTVLDAALKAGFSALLCTVKTSDPAAYVRRCHEAGRAPSIVPFGPGHTAVYNPFEAQLLRTDAGGRSARCIVDLVMTLLEVGNRASSQDSGDNAAYFLALMNELTTCTVDLLIQSIGEVSIPLMSEVIFSAPLTVEQGCSAEWRERSLCWKCIEMASGRPKTEIAAGDFRLSADFFMFKFAGLSSKTRASVTSKFSSLVDSLQRGVIRTLISGKSTITPASVLANNQILIVDAPTKLHGSAGKFLNVLWKVGMQQELERQNVDSNTIPTLIAEDESHILVTEGDAVFQTTARSSRAMVLKSTQSHVNYLAELGPNSEAAVFSLIGSHQTHIFHQQSCTRHNSFASELLGQVKRFSINLNSNSEDAGSLRSAFGFAPRTSSAGMSEAWEPAVQPSVFTQLAKGGAPRYQVEGIVYQGGRTFPSTGAPWMFTRFPQRF